MDLLQEFCSYALVEHKPMGEKGEDSYSFDFTSSYIHTQAVFDGCGGAGAWKYPEFNNATGAYVAAQTIAPAFQNWSSKIQEHSAIVPDDAAESFRSMAQSELVARKKACAPMGVTGSLVKSFPCTAAIAIQQITETHQVRLTALNAGDSRVYFLTPETGLVQVTKDDSRGSPDPLESLRDSAPLSNLINADKAFRVTPSQIDLSFPCAIICATDGMFGFLRSPMDFEYLLLRTLLQARSMHEFETSFQSQIAKITGDDSTCIMSFYGWKDMSAIRTSLKHRFDYIAKIVSALDVAQTDHEHFDEVLHAQWLQYKESTLLYE